MISIDFVRDVAVLDEFASELSVDLKSPIHLTMPSFYFSPRGWNTKEHYDQHENLVMQLRGTKRWYVARHPRTHIEELSADDVLTVDLLPGSVLLVPRWNYHRTETIEESVSISIEILTVTWAEAFCNHLRTLLNKAAPWGAPIGSAYIDGNTFLSHSEHLSSLVRASPPVVTYDTSEAEQALLGNMRPLTSRYRSLPDAIGVDNLANVVIRDSQGAEILRWMLGHDKVFSILDASKSLRDVPMHELVRISNQLLKLGLLERCY